MLTKPRLALPASGPRSSRSLLWRSLRGRSDWRDGHGNYLRRVVKYLYRCACRPRQQQRWLGFLYGRPEMARICAAQPRLHERPHRSFISTHFHSGQRCRLACRHFDYLLDTWSWGLMEQIHLHKGAVLGEFRLKNDSLYHFIMHYPSGDREGELALALQNEQGLRIATMTLTIDPVERRLLIGCVQGSDLDLGREAIAEFTRASDGLRPKNLLLSVCYGLVGVLLPGGRIYGVTQAAHPYLGSMTKHGIPKLNSDYDAFWRESGGEVAEDGFFALPVEEPVREASQVPSKRRAALRRREALREEAVTRFLDAMLAHCKAPGVGSAALLRHRGEA